MNVARVALFLLLTACVGIGQISSSAGDPPPANAQPIDAQLHELLGQLEVTSQNSALQLARMRIDKWKTDGDVKREAQQNSDALQRNLTSAMPQLISSVRSNPNDVAANFKLYRNLNVVYEYFAQLAEGAGAFGKKEEYQPLEKQVGDMEGVRRTLADRLEMMTSQVSAELQRLRQQVRTAQAAAPSAAPKRIVVDDNAPAKKPAKRKTVPKPPSQ
jgi:hypothetical protein